MRTILTIAAKELKSFFTSAVGYVVLGSFIAFTGLIFVLVVNQPQAVATMDPIFRNCTIALVMILPLLTMRLLAGERSGDQGTGTIELLLTAPISEWQLVLGKYLATVLYVLVMIVCSLIYPVALKVLGKPDMGPIYSGYLGMMLFSGYILAFGVLTSALTNSQIVAAVTGIIGSLLLWLVSFVGQMGDGSKWAEFLSWSSMLSHHEDFWRGMITLVDVAWYLSFIFFFLYCAKLVLSSSKWR